MFIAQPQNYQAKKILLFLKKLCFSMRTEYVRKMLFMVRNIYIYIIYTTVPSQHRIQPGNKFCLYNVAGTRSLNVLIFYEMFLWVWGCCCALFFSYLFRFVGVVCAALFCRFMGGFCDYFRVSKWVFFFLLLLSQLYMANKSVGNISDGWKVIKLYLWRSFCGLILEYTVASIS